MEWQRHLELFVLLFVFPSGLVYFFPKTWQWPTANCELKNRNLRIYLSGDMDAFLMGAVLGIVIAFFRHQKIEILELIMVLLSLCAVKFLIFFFMRYQYLISVSGIEYKTPFSSGFMAWNDMTEVNIVAPERRIMFRGENAKIVLNLFPTQFLGFSFDGPRIARLIARFAKKQLRNNKKVMWST
jgi:hypothetical protein